MKKWKNISKASYINKMLPHLLPIKAKELEITQKDKEEWRKLADQIKENLTKRYFKHFRYEFYVLENDMAYNKKNYVPKQPPQKPIKPVIKSDELNDSIVDSLQTTEYKREWIRKSRMELLESLRMDEAKLTILFKRQNVEVYNKMPFIINNKIIFADLYLPEYRTIIEISNKYKTTKQNRLSALGSTNNTLVNVDCNKVKDKVYIHNFVYNIIKHYKKYSK